MLFVIDTSTLIILQKLGWLSLCSQSDNEFIWPPSVTQELKIHKAKNREILVLLTSGITREVEIHKHLIITEISSTDAEVISLAEEHQATVISEDIPLREKALKLGLSAFSLAVLVTIFYQHGFLLKDECLARLKELYGERFLSKSEYHKLLQGLTS